MCVVVHDGIGQRGAQRKFHSTQPRRAWAASPDRLVRAWRHSDSNAIGPCCTSEGIRQCRRGLLPCPRRRRRRRVQAIASSIQQSDWVQFELAVQHRHRLAYAQRRQRHACPECRIVGAAGMPCRFLDPKLLLARPPPAQHPVRSFHLERCAGLRSHF